MSFINEKINQIVDAYNENKLGDPLILKMFYELNNKDKLLILQGINEKIKINNDEKPNFKNEKYGPLFEFIVDNINSMCIYKNKYVNNFLLDTLLESLTRLYKGQYLLGKLNKHIVSLVKIDSILIKYLLIASEHGTLVTFMFWLNKTKNRNLESVPQTILQQIYVKSIYNSDDRLYKYILNYIKKHNKLFFLTNNKNIKNLISSLAMSKIPPKYKLKRIRILSEQTSLIPYFNHMIESFNSEKILTELHKHYYIKPHSYEILYYLIINMSYHDENNLNLLLNKTSINNIMNILKTEKERISIKIIISLYTCKNYNFNIVDTSTFEKIIIENFILINRFIDWSNFINTLDSVDLNKKIISIIVNNNLMTQLLNIKKIYIYDYRILCFTKFLSVFSSSNKKTTIAINLFLHKLRLLAKMKKKSNILNHKVIKFDLHNEIVNFIPNKKFAVLTNGSKEYQYEKQRFTNLPPRHLLYDELSIYTNFLLREKADGILINNLPIGIYPKSSIIHNYHIKAEYIEDIDLYLIFDIDIPNTSIIDRYNILRQAHPYTKKSDDNIDTVNNLNDMILLIEKERIQIKKFIDENKYNQIKWYPKFACKYSYNTDNSSIYKELIEQIILEKNTKLCTKLNKYELYNCDGLIISPLDGRREIKIKSKSQTTIDLMCMGDKWLDRNNNDWSHIIIKPKTNKKKNKVYRCYPQLKPQLKFNIGEYRYDKIQANPYNVVDSIINILNNDWINNSTDNKSYYYDESKILKSSKLIKMIQFQNNLFEEQIKILNPSINTNWLDLGCGKGKSIHTIKKYNPNNYMGLDIDIKLLVKALEHHDENQNVYMFNPCDLSANWKITKNKWFNFDNIKYDYIVANFSLMHFCTDDFWTQLDKIVHKETKFLFNFIDIDNSDTIEWKESESFLELKDNIIRYKFEWTHNEIKTEPLISKDIINSYLNKFGWKIIETTTYNSQYTLVNFYSWWIIQKL